MKAKASRVRKSYERHRYCVALLGKSKTHQSHAEACDINNIISRYERTGELPNNRRGEPRYADVTGLQGDPTELFVESERIINTADDFAQGWKPKEEEEPEEKPADKPLESKPPGEDKGA